MQIPSRRLLHKLALFLLILTFVASLVPMSGIAAEETGPAAVEAISVPTDAFEADNSLAMAKPITVGPAWQERTIHQVYNDDWVKFSAKKGSTYIIETTAADSSFVIDDVASIDFTYGDYPPAYHQLELYNAQGEHLKDSGEMYIREEAPSKDESRLAAESVAVGKIDRVDGVQRMVTWTAPKDMTAYVRVAALWDPEFGGVGQYLLRARAVVPSISGRVTDENGDPLPMTYVYAYSADDSLAEVGAGWGEAWTDSNGDYVLPDLPAGEYVVGFEPWSWRYRYEYYDDAFAEASATPVAVTGGLVGASNIDAQLELWPDQIWGQLVDESGAPIEGVQATLYIYVSWWWSPSWWPYMWTYTDAGGNYSFSDIASYYPNRVVFRDQNTPARYAAEGWDDTLADVYSATTIPLTNELMPGYYAAESACDATLTTIPYVLDGTVKNNEGEPIDGVAAAIYDAGDQSYLGDAYTDANGYWRWTGIFAGDVKVEFYDDYYPARYAGEFYDDVAEWSEATTLTVSHTSPPTIHAVLDDAPPAIGGTVTDANTGAGLAGIQVWAYSWDSGWEQYYPYDMAVTDKNGDYALDDLFYEDVVLQFADPAGVYASEYFDNQPRVEDAWWVWAAPKSEVIADAALVKQGGRVFGYDRFGTSAALAEEAYPGWIGISDVVVASGLDAAAADALSAASLCWAYDAPLLLTHKDYTPPVVADVLADIIDVNEGVQVHVVGGPASVPDARLAEMGAIVGAGNIERVPWGQNRYDNARKVSMEASRVADMYAMEMPGFLFVANGSDFNKFFDALSASSISANTGAPVLLVKTDSVPAETLLALDDFAEFDRFVVGGASTVTKDVYTQVGGDDRIWGATRYDTSVALAQRALNLGWLQVDKIGVAAKIADALSGGVSVGLQGGPLVTTASDELPGVTYAFIDKHDQMIGQVVIFGGPNSVSAKVASQIALALAQ